MFRQHATGKKVFIQVKKLKEMDLGKMHMKSIIAHTALSTFCGLINLPTPMQSKAFNEMQENLSEAYKQVADVSMQNAADEFKFSEAER